eukprot:TRINITY_DN3803_c0_g1_i1.p1 TRINITY_DN3803_c0_g1~~TRINITY_DN3803_c0_g1_i1.p1  ORF type:complete len:1173 (-),score=319.13 TRINITY_DN3803_c0_g1_i1:149-3667(-)
MVFPETNPDWNLLSSPQPRMLTQQQKTEFLRDALVTEQLRDPEAIVLRDEELQSFCTQYYGEPASSNRATNIAALRMAKTELEAVNTMRNIQDTDVARQSSTRKRRDVFSETPSARNADAGMYTNVLAINNVKDTEPHLSWEELHEDPSSLQNLGFQAKAEELLHFQKCEREVLKQRRDGDNLTVSGNQGEDPRRGRITSGLFLARSFRVGWGPSGELVHPGGKINTNDCGTGKLTYCVQMQQLGVSQALLTAGTEDGESSDAIEDALKRRCVRMLTAHHELCEQKAEGENDNQPNYQEPYPLPTLRLRQDATRLPEICSKFYDICREPVPVPRGALRRSSFMRHESSLWSLVNILWGVPANIRKTTRSLHAVGKNAFPALERLRRNALDDWLKASCESYLNSEKCWDSQEAGLSKVFGALCANDLQGACDAAIAAKDTKLALLISQIQVTSQCDVQRLLKLQLCQWKESGMFPGHFSEAQQRLYLLLSGQVSESCRDINPHQCASIHQWRLRFGLHFWHESTSHIKQAMQRYHALLEAGEGLVPYPVPPHAMDFESYAREHKFEEKNSYLTRRAGSMRPQECIMARQPEPAAVVYDTAFNLLELYRHDSGLSTDTQLRQSLEPRGSSPLPLDVHTGWFLSEVLQMQGVLQGEGREFYNQENRQESAQAHQARVMLTAGFAHELVLLGLWDWAIYVLLNLRADPAVIYRAVNDILSRHLPVEQSSKDGLLLRFGLPQEMLDLSRAVRARYEADVQGGSYSRTWCLEQSVKCHIAAHKLKQAEATLVVDLCPAQLIKEPPYYLRVKFDLTPAQMVIAGLLTSAGSLRNEIEADPEALCFEVVVEVWESDSWATCLEELVQPRQQQPRDMHKHRQVATEAAQLYREQGQLEEAERMDLLAQRLAVALEEVAGRKKTTTCAQLGLSLQNLNGVMMWRLELTSLECHKSIVEAMGMDNQRRQQFQSHLQLHESMWKPCPLTIQPKTGVLRLDQQEAIVSVQQSFVLEQLDKIRELSAEMNAVGVSEQEGDMYLQYMKTRSRASEQKGDMFLRYMKLIRRQTYKEMGVESDANDLQALAQVAKWTHREKVDKAECNSQSQWAPAAMFEDGDERPQQPVPADQQELKAALDHVSKNMIARCMPDVQSELQNIHLLKDVSTLEVDRLRMLQKACDDVMC